MNIWLSWALQVFFSLGNYYSSEQSSSRLEALNSYTRDQNALMVTGFHFYLSYAHFTVWFINVLYGAYSCKMFVFMCDTSFHLTCLVCDKSRTDFCSNTGTGVP